MEKGTKVTLKKVVSSMGKELLSHQGLLETDLQHVLKVTQPGIFITSVDYYGYVVYVATVDLIDVEMANHPNKLLRWAFSED